MKPIARLTVSRQRIHEKGCDEDETRFGSSEFEELETRREFFLNSCPKFFTKFN